MNQFKILAVTLAFASLTSAGFIFDDLEPKLYAKDEKIDILVGNLK